MSNAIGNKILSPYASSAYSVLISNIATFCERNKIENYIFLKPRPISVDLNSKIYTHIDYYKIEEELLKKLNKISDLDNSLIISHETTKPLNIKNSINIVHYVKDNLELGKYCYSGIKKYKNEYLKNLPTVLNGLDPDNYSVSRNIKNYSLYIGRLIKIYRVDKLFNTFNKNKELGELIVCGHLQPNVVNSDGDDINTELEYQENLVKYFNSKIIHQPSSGIDKIKYIKNAKVVFGALGSIVMMESLMCGVPFVALNFKNNKIDDYHYQHGLTIVNNEQGIIDYMSNQTYKFFSKKSVREEAINKFSVKNTLKGYYELTKNFYT